MDPGQLLGILLYLVDFGDILAEFTEIADFLVFDRGFDRGFQRELRQFLLKNTCLNILPKSPIFSFLSELRRKKKGARKT